MKQPSSRHLSHDFEAYKGLSLRELFWLVLITTAFVSLLFILIGFFIGYPLAFGCLGFLAGFILSITLCPKHAAHVKAGKPHGYLMKRTLLLMAKCRLIKSPYIHYKGFWQKSKIIRSSHV